MDDEQQNQLDKELEDQEFWQICDDLLELEHGDKARRWLVMLEDPDPDDLIFAYMRIVRTIAYARGYSQGVLNSAR